MGNNETYLYKCIINNIQSYIIISDLYFIILNRIQENFQKGQMKYYCEINKLNLKIDNNDKQRYKINLSYFEDKDKTEKEINYQIMFEKEIFFKDFCDNFSKKKSKLATFLK